MDAGARVVVDVSYSPAMASPNVLVIMTDEERYPPPYETADGHGVPANADAKS